MESKKLKYSDKNLVEMHSNHIEMVGHTASSNPHHTQSAVHLHIEGDEHMTDVEISKRGIRPLTKAVGHYGFDDLWKAYIVEFTACIIFILMENYSKGDLNVAIFGIYVLITTLYPVSGANMNGCVSLALWYYEEEFVPVHIWRRGVYIFFIQPLGHFVGHMISLAVVGPNLIYLKPRDTDPFKIAFCEFLWTGCLIFTALHCIVSRYTRPAKDFMLQFLFFVAMLYFVSKAGSEISGASYNPTKYIIMQGIAFSRGIEPNALQNWYCYIFPQFIGTCFFTCVFKYLFDPVYYRMLKLKYKWEDSFFVEKWH